MSPELTLLIVNAVLLAYAYLWAYPALKEKTWRVIMVRDLGISFAALTVAGLLYWGSGVRFSLVLFQSNWLAFSFVSLMIMETPLFIWFAKKYDLRFDDL